MKKYKIITQAKLKKLAKKSSDSWLDGWNGDTEGSYMESIFNDNGNAIPLGKKGHLWVRATPLKDGSILFLRKELIDEVVSKLDMKTIKQRYLDLKNGTVERESYPHEEYYDLIDDTLFDVFFEYKEDIKNGYVNLYDYILNEIFPKKTKS
jgi:hypothetical protein